MSSSGSPAPSWRSTLGVSEAAFIYVIQGCKVLTLVDALLAGASSGNHTQPCRHASRKGYCCSAGASGHGAINSRYVLAEIHLRPCLQARCRALPIFIGVRVIVATDVISVAGTNVYPRGLQFDGVRD
jgi:hypothetical protein